MQLTVSLRGVPAITLPIEGADEVRKIEQRFAAFAEFVKMTPAALAHDMVLAYDALGRDSDPVMLECQMCGLLFFALQIEGTTRPGPLKAYLAAHNFTVDLSCDHRRERIFWHVEGFGERPN